MGRNWYRNCSVLRTDSVLSFSFDCTASVFSYVRKVYSRYPLGILILAFPISRCLHEIFGFSFQGLHPCRARSVCCLHERRVHTRRAPRSKIDPRTTPDMCVFLSPLQPGIPRVLACPTFASILRVHRLSFPVCPLRRSRRFSSAAVPVRTHVRRAGSVHACGTRA